jgi:hypothetical protein
LAEIFFFSATPTLSVVADAFVSFGLANEAAMDPEPNWIESSLFCVIDDVVESPHHKFCNFFAAVLE